MADVYLYYFIGPNGPDGERMLSTRPATLEAIRCRGEPVMESQIVADHTQLDAGGFLVGIIGNDSYVINDLTTQIWSLEVRAASREKDALGCADGIEQYMLSLESRELRKQAQILNCRRSELMARELSHGTDTGDFVEFGASLAAE
jgi:hypothetical protein